MLCGSVGISPAAVHLLCEAAIPIIHLSRGHWFYGVTTGIHLKNAYGRVAQYAAACDTNRQLHFAKRIVAAKAANQRTLLRRNGQPRPDTQLDEMSRVTKSIANASNLGELLGLEGTVAAAYFKRFASMLRAGNVETVWNFEGRNRRPPADPVNALLSFGYALLAKECTTALLAEGLDPWWGLFHQPRHGRPSLALDLMEEFRPLVVDSAVVTAINTRMVEQSDFITTAAGCSMTDSGRKAMIRAYEARLDHLITHPVFKYRCSWRSVIRVQARLLARWLRNDVSEYVGITTR